MNKTLEELRKEINIVDDEIIHILAKRMDIVEKIGKIKKEHNITPLDEIRWQEVLEQVFKNAKKNKLSQLMIKKIYEAIHDAALEVEKEHE